MAAKAQDLPGVEGPGVSRPKIKAIEVAADDYVEVRDKRMAMTTKEIAARTKLVDVMKKHGLLRYQFSDHEVVMVPGQDKVRVRTIDDTHTDEGGEDAGTE